MLKTKIEGFDEVQEVLKEYREGGALELKQYRTIGTVEECREAREKQIPKKPIHDGLYACPNCHTIMLQGAFEARGRCCKECGQVLDWSETV